MPRTAGTDRLAILRKKQEQVANQIKTIEARAKEQSRKDDARRKIVAGALALEHLTKNPESEFGKQMIRLLDEYVEPRNRTLFPYLPEKPKAERGVGGAA